MRCDFGDKLELEGIFFFWPLAVGEGTAPLAEPCKVAKVELSFLCQRLNVGPIQ